MNTPMKKRGTWITVEQAQVELHNWKMMHPAHTSEELRAAMAEIHGRIKR